MTSGTWDRHTGRTDTYDVLTVGYNYRIDEPRSALLLSRLARLEADIERRRELVRRYRARSPGRRHHRAVPYEEDESCSSCYVMPVCPSTPRRARRARPAASSGTACRRASLSPRSTSSRAYRARFRGVSLPRTEHAGRANICLPMFGHLSEGELDRVVETLEEALR